MVLPKGMSMESLTTSFGMTVQYPINSTTAVTNTEGIQALVIFATYSPIMYTTVQNLFKSFSPSHL